MTNEEAIALLRNLEDSLDSYYGLNEKGKTAFDMAIEALKQTAWTPCSESLPEDVEEGEEYPTVIYCTKNYVSTGFYDYVTKKWWDIEGYPVGVIVDVVAWMPLPEPAKLEND